MSRSATHKPALAWFTAVGAAWVFVLVALGAFTTTIGAGMAFPDWPLSNGSVNPHGWLTEIDKFAEHSHRLSATLMGTITVIIAVWLHRREERAWLRRLGWAAVGLVIFQGVVGGLRVLLDRLHVPLIDTSVGRLFAMAHAVLAQAFVCTLFAIALACSRAWIERHAGLAAAPAPRLRRLGRWLVALFFVQLAIAAIVRHSFAGLAIPSFPASTPDGAWLPATWDFRVAIQFAHRVMAVALGCGVLAFGHLLFRERAAAAFLRGTSVLLVALISLQVTLGAQIIWTGRSILMTTGHVVVGALTLATTFVVTFALHRRDLDPTGP